MDDQLSNPRIKPPSDYTGQGVEYIGDISKGASQGTLVFIDGRFVSLGKPTANAAAKGWRRFRATQLSENILKGLASAREREELNALLMECRKRVPRDRATENAVKRILSGDPSPNWSLQNRREEAALTAIQELARERQRPPSEADVIDRMAILTETAEGREVKVIADSDRKNLARVVRAVGFGWLERRRRGFQGERG